MARKVNVFKDGTKLRRGGSTQGPDNILDKLTPGDYDALYQCAGEKVTDGGATNFWWVKVHANGQDGWVSGTCVDKEGTDNAPIRDTTGQPLPEEPTRFV